ncbi:alginate lyase family protein [Actinocorallia longicatena]|uniref:Alginate lyase family protein n=1 Tax=Actinocorallia longicatena TaxID=111803 RepID=A0ABP6Q625_9ACTN
MRDPLVLLTERADGLLGKGPWSVTAKPGPPPGGDVHDYLSAAPYWWPRPGTPDGLPYVRRDGVRNPAAATATDHAARGAMFTAGHDLTLAWHHTGRARYARRAALVLRTWFLDPATRMNPNLDHAQIVPGREGGRGAGVIDFSQRYADVLAAVAVLDAGAPGWTGSDRDGMRAWNSAFLAWLRGGANGRAAAAAAGNHGSYHDLLLAALALATGDGALAAATVAAAGTGRVDVQIAPDGAQPLELARTRSWHYSVFNLAALTHLARLGEGLGADLWRHRTPGGATLLRAVDLLVPAATGAAPWPRPESSFDPSAATGVVRAAAETGDPVAAAAVPLLRRPPGDVWPLRLPDVT